MVSLERGLITHSKFLGTLAWCRKTVNICRSVDRWLQENVPDGSTVELGFGHSRIPVIVQDRSNIEHGQYRGDREVHRPKGQLLAETNPTGIHGFDYS